MTGEVAGRTSLSGDEVRRMFAQSAASLSRNAAAIDAINVFPVPDGDTGSNMSATLNAAVEAREGGSAAASEVLTVMARGALLGARGNSGVILSQILRGLANGVADAGSLDAPALAAAFSAAQETAYRAVGTPVEGTILTVLRDVATEAARRAHPGLALVEFVGDVVECARCSVARTPELLPVLKQAGVVDSGGLGLLVILEGCLSFLRGEPPSQQSASVQAPSLGRQRADGAHHGAFGYCTEFLIAGAELDADAIKACVQRLGESVLVVGEPSLLHVHLHTPDPGPALSLGVGLGTLLKIKIENMDAKHRELLDSPAVAAGASLIAVALGAGFEQILRDYGAIVVQGGQTMNPSVEEILRPIEDSSGAEAIVLPNNKNVVLTAEQAAGLARKPVRVLPSMSVAQGIAAVLAYRPEARLEDNVASMTDAMTGVRTIAVTRAARSLTLHGIQVAQGQPLGLIDDSVATSGETPNQAALAAIEALHPGSGALTIYYGQDLSLPDAEALGAEAGRRWPEIEVQVVSGGHPFYEYTIALE